jgi:hypothetical protein
MGGGLQSLIQAGAGGAGAGGVRGGGLSSDIMPSASPNPLGQMGNMFPGHPPPPPRPPALDAGTTPLNYGMQTPQQNAMELATGSSVIDPFTGQPVPSASATGNSLGGPSATGMAAAMKELGSQTPEKLLGMGGRSVLAGGAGEDVLQDAAGKYDPSKDWRFGGKGDPFGADLPAPPPAPLPPPAPGRKPQMPETPLGLPTDRFIPFGEHPQSNRFLMPPGSQTPAESPHASVNDWIMLNPSTGQVIPAPQPPGNQMIRRPPDVPRPGIDILTPPPREDRPGPSGPSPLWRNYERDQTLDVPKLPPKDMDRLGDGLFYKPKEDLHIDPQQFPNMQQNPDLFPWMPPGHGQERYDSPYPSAKDPRYPTRRVEGVDITRLPVQWAKYEDAARGEVPRPEDLDLRTPVIYPQQEMRLLPTRSDMPQIDPYDYPTEDRPWTAPPRVQTVRNDNVSPEGGDRWNFFSEMNSRGPSAAFQHRLNTEKNIMSPFDIWDQQDRGGPGPPANRNVAPPPLKPISGRDDHKLVTTNRSTDGRTQVAMADIPSDALSYATATDAAQNAPPEDAVPQRTIGQQIQEYFNPLTNTIDRVIKTPLPQALPTEPVPGAGTGNRQTGAASEPTTSVAQRAYEAFPTLPTLPEVGQNVMEYFKPLTEPLANAVQAPLPPLPQGIPTPGPSYSPYGTATAMRPEELTPAFNPQGTHMPGDPLPTNLAVSQALGNIASSGGSAAQSVWDYFAGVPERQGPPIPPAVSAAGAAPGAAEVKPQAPVRYELPSEIPSASQQLGPARSVPTQTIHIAPDGTITYGPKPPTGAPTLPPPSATQPVVAPSPAIQPRAALPQGPMSSATALSTPRPLVPPTVQVSKQPIVRNPDGSISTVQTMGIHDEKGYVNLPMVSKSGKVLSPDEAVREYQRTGGHLGIYKSQAEADRGAELLHQSEEARFPGRSTDSLQRYFQNAYGMESRGRDTAANPRSTARGKGQFIESTWLSTVDAAVPDLAGRLTREQKLALRHDPAWMDSMMLYHTKYNVGKLEEKGIPPTNANIFALHRLGTAGGMRVIQNPDRPIASIVGAKAVALNPDLRQTGRSWLAGLEAKLSGGGGGNLVGGAGSDSVASRPAVRGTPEPELANAAAQMFAQATSTTVPNQTPAVTSTRRPPATTTVTPEGVETTPGGRIVPKVTPNVAEPPPVKIPDAKIDTEKVREAVKGLTPAQVVRQTDSERKWGRLAGLFRGMANGKSWGDMFMGGASGVLGARSAEATEDRSAAQTEADRDFQYRQRQAQAEIDIATRYDPQNAQGDINAANVNAEREYEVKRANAAAEVAAGNTMEQRRAEALNAEREEAKPKIQVTDRGVAVTKTEPATGETTITYSQNPLADKADDLFKRAKERASLFAADDFAAQRLAYEDLGRELGSDGVKLRMLGDLAQNERYMSVLGGFPQLVARLKAVVETANKLVPLEQRVSDPKGTAARNEQVVRDELTRLWQSGQLGEGWIEEMKKIGHPGATLLQRRGGDNNPSPVPDARRDSMPSGLGQGAAFGQ